MHKKDKAISGIHLYKEHCQKNNKTEFNWVKEKVRVKTSWKEKFSLEINVDLKTVFKQILWIWYVTNKCGKCEWNSTIRYPGAGKL